MLGTKCVMTKMVIMVELRVGVLESESRRPGNVALGCSALAPGMFQISLLQIKAQVWA